MTKPRGKESRPEFLRRHLAALEQDIEDIREAGSWQALVAANRQILAARAELDSLEQAAPPAEEGMTESDLVAMMVEAIETLPLSALPAIEAALTRRRG